MRFNVGDWVYSPRFGLCGQVAAVLGPDKLRIAHPFDVLEEDQIAVARIPAPKYAIGEEVEAPANSCRTLVPVRVLGHDYQPGLGWEYLVVVFNALALLDGIHMTVGEAKLQRRAGEVGHG